MPSGPRIRANNSYGLTTDAPLTIGATTFNSAGLVTLPTVAAAHAIVTLDPLREFGEPEIVVVTAHTAAATVATIVRGQYGTVARSHPVSTTWVHAPLDEDFVENVALTTEILDPYRGQMLFDRTLNRYVGRETTDIWSNVNMLADPPACRARRVANQSIAHGAGGQALSFDTEDLDTNGMFAPTSSVFTVVTPGLFIVTGNLTMATATDYSSILYEVVAGGVVLSGQHVGTINPSGTGISLSASGIAKLTAGQTITTAIFHVNGASAARNATGNLHATWLGRG